MGTKEKEKLRTNNSNEARAVQAAATEASTRPKTQSMLSAWNQQEKDKHGRFFDAKGVLFGGQNVRSTALKVRQIAKVGNKATDMM